MSNPVIRFPLDITGLNPDNFIDGEIHALSNKPVRVVAPTYGAFFTESLKVYDNRTQKLLVRGTQYLCTELLQIPTEMYGKELCYLIVIIDPTITPEVIIQYQALGGLYTRSGDALVNIYNTIMNDERPVNWLDVLNRPLEFPPTSHLHDIRDVYGFQYLVVALERLRNAVIGSDVPVYESIMDWLTQQITALRNAQQSDLSILSQHAARTDNPHKILKSQIDLGNVDNLASATTADVNAVFTYPANSSETIVPTDKFVTLKKLLTFRNGTITLVNNALANVTTAISNATSGSAPITHVGATGSAHGVATSTVNGFMNAADKSKLDAITGTVTGTNTGDQTNIAGHAALDLPLTGGTLTGTLTGTAFRAAQGLPASDAAIVGYGFGVDGDTGMFASGSGSAAGVIKFYGNSSPMATLSNAGLVVNSNVTGLNLSGINTGDQTTITGNAGTATAAAGNSFMTAGIGAVGTENDIGVNCNGYNSAYLFNNATSWGLYSLSGGTLLNYTRANSTINVGRIVTNAITYGSYGSISITGSTSGYAGIVFNDTAGCFMDNGSTHGFYRSNSGWTWSATNTDFAVNGNLTAYSDERLKTNWKPLPLNFIQNWSQVKYGIYDRIDTGATQVGLSAQSVKAVLPNAVTEQEGGMLALNYGAAAAVATVELAKQSLIHSSEISMLLDIIQNLQERLTVLESK
jgi:hypothetical protein